MSGATPPNPITPGQVNRQVIAYGDRPMGVVRDGQVYMTHDFYQWTNRLGQGFGTTSGNVNTLIETTNTISGDVGALQTEIATIDAEIAAIEAEIAALPTGFPPPPVPPLAPPIVEAAGMLAPPAQAALPAPSAVPLALAPSLIPPLLAPPPAPLMVPSTQGWQLLSTFRPSAVSSLVMVLPAGFERYHLSFQGATVNTGGAFLQLQVSVNGGATFITGATYQQFGFLLNSTSMAQFNAPGSGVLLGTGLTSGGVAAFDGDFDVFTGNASQVALISGRSSGLSSVPAWFVMESAGAIIVTGPVNAIQVVPSSGTFSGTFFLLGLP